VSFRCDRVALQVLEWEAQQTGIPLRTRIRAWVEARAEEVSGEYRAFEYERVEKHLGEAGEVPVAPPGDHHNDDLGGQ
jgi:hypothetical protein